jgi:uncharacterized protein with NAD-binding domain and iron-sulfur cluster
LKKIPPAAITAVHLWFDLPITPLPHAILAGRLSQWIFNKTSTGSSDNSHYYQVVISASHRLVKWGKVELVDTVLSDLKAVFPETGRAKLLNWRVVTVPQAVFSLQPGVDRIRPLQNTSIENLFFAGDWTATGWPGTMEGAVWSGYSAAQGVLKYLGR